MENSLTPKQLKLAVTRSIALDPDLSARIAQEVGFTPLWSRMTITELAAVWKVWERLTTTSEDRSDK